MACSPSQGFTFGKAGEILTKRLRYMVFRSMLRQVCLLRIVAGCAELPAGARGLMQRECGRVTQSELLCRSSLGLSSELWLNCCPQVWLRGPDVHLLWVGQGTGLSQMIPRAGSSPAFGLAAGGRVSNTSHPFPLFLSFLPLGNPRRKCFFSPRDAACALSFHKSKCVPTAQGFLHRG